MDDIDRKIARLLAVDARRPLADIGGEVGLSASAVNERMRRMVASGAIRRFTVDLDPAAYGTPVLAFVFVALGPDADEQSFRRFAQDHVSIIECHHVTGGWSYLVKVRVADLDGIEAFLSEMKRAGYVGRSETILSLSSPAPDVVVPAVETK